MIFCYIKRENDAQMYHKFYYFIRYILSEKVAPIIDKLDCLTKLLKIKYFLKGG